MNKNIETENYLKVSLIYNYLMKGIDYGAWANYLNGLVKPELKNSSKVLELAAGSCNLANNFVKYFPNLVVSDLSWYMLKTDRKNQIPKVCCDMIKLPFRIKFNLIYLTFDSINYLTSKKKLLELFKQISTLLDVNGIFTFDASLERNSLVHIKQPVREGDYLGIHFKQISEYRKASRIHKNIFSIIHNNTAYTEVHKQKIFRFETYFEMLEIAGLYVKECYDTFTRKTGSPNSERVQFITKRKSNVKF